MKRNGIGKACLKLRKPKSVCFAVVVLSTGQLQTKIRRKKKTWTEHLEASKNGHAHAALEDLRRQASEEGTI